MMDDRLQQAAELIRSNDRQGAGRLLIPYLKENPQEAEGWWLLANATQDQEVARKALQRLLKLRPNDIRANNLLAELGEESLPSLGDVLSNAVQYASVDVSQPPKRKRGSPNNNVWLWAVVSVLLVIAVGLVGVVFL